MPNDDFPGRFFADWQPDALAAQLGSILGDPATWAETSARARRLTPADAAERLVADCEALMAGGR